MSILKSVQKQVNYYYMYNDNSDDLEYYLQMA